MPFHFAPTVCGAFAGLASTRSGVALAALLTVWIPLDALGAEIVGHVEMEEFRGARSVDSRGAERFIYYRDGVAFEETIVTAAREETAIELLDPTGVRRFLCYRRFCANADSEFARAVTDSPMLISIIAPNGRRRVGRVLSLV